MPREPTCADQLLTGGHMSERSGERDRHHILGPGHRRRPHGKLQVPRHIPRPRLRKGRHEVSDVGVYWRL
jgi:hypothetical protein